MADWLLVGKKPVRARRWTSAAACRPKDVDRGRLKGEVTAMLAALAERPDLLDALHRARNLPAARFADADWAIVAALLQVLPQAAAQLIAGVRRRTARSTSRS